tara:strand:+ start:269 stop:511 length:243 start_codon:yes stop_codon:yes gene_type:complete
MGKMKQIAELIRNNDVDLLRRLIKHSENANRRDVPFLGKMYTIEDAQQILLFMYDEKARQDKIRREQLSVEDVEDTSNND